MSKINLEDIKKIIDSRNKCESYPNCEKCNYNQTSHCYLDISEKGYVEIIENLIKVDLDWGSQR